MTQQENSSETNQVLAGILPSCGMKPEDSEKPLASTAITIAFEGLGRSFLGAMTDEIGYRMSHPQMPIVEKPLDTR